MIGSLDSSSVVEGLLIHGIFPGSDLFDNDPEVAWTFIDSMLVGQILMCIFGLYVAGLAARVAQVPDAAMAAVVLGLALFGNSVQHSMGDVHVMAGLGTGIYFRERFGFSAAPLVLGLIPGPIDEGRRLAHAHHGPRRGPRDVEGARSHAVRAACRALRPKPTAGWGGHPSCARPRRTR